MNSLSFITFLHWRRKWQPTPVFLPGESQGRGSLVGCSLWGRTESDTTSNLAAAAETWVKDLLFYIKVIKKKKKKKTQKILLLLILHPLHNLKQLFLVCVSHSVISNSLRLHGLYPTRLLFPWDFPGKNTGVSSHPLL